MARINSKVVYWGELQLRLSESAHDLNLYVWKPLSLSWVCLLRTDSFPEWCTDWHQSGKQAGFRYSSSSVSWMEGLHLPLVSSAPICWFNLSSCYLVLRRGELKGFLFIQPAGRGFLSTSKTSVSTFCLETLCGIAGILQTPCKASAWPLYLAALLTAKVQHWEHNERCNGKTKMSEKRKFLCRERSFWLINKHEEKRWKHEENNIFFLLNWLYKDSCIPQKIFYVQDCFSHIFAWTSLLPPWMVTLIS